MKESLNKKPRALLSVTDKASLEIVGTFLIESGYEILSSGGTGAYLSKFQIPFTPIEKITGHGEAFGGRMKTLSFEIESALLYDRSKDAKEAAKLGIDPIDVVICNFYPFEEKSKHDNLDELIEAIDIGGPTMLRAGAKNHSGVVVLSHQSQYAEFIKAHQAGEISIDLRRKWALAAFQMSARYELFIAKTLEQVWQSPPQVEKLSTEDKELRYGENPHQKSFMIKSIESLKEIIQKNSANTPQGIAHAEVLQGKELSYNNLLDVDAAWRIVSDLTLRFTDKKTVAIIKHSNPCGLASHADQFTALQVAWETDPVSRFGGIIAFTDTITIKEAQFLKDHFIEVLMAPAIEPAALTILSSKKNLRILTTPLKTAQQKEWMVRSISGGYLAQQEDEIYFHEFQSVTEKKLTVEQKDLAEFAMISAKHLKSNALALVEPISGGYNLISSGMGQPNRVDCLDKLAFPRLKNLLQLRESTGGVKVEMKDLILASDAFFPFSDIAELAHDLKIQTLIQPGGSIKDSEVIQKCNDLGLCMAFTGVRHFRH